MIKYLFTSGKTKGDLESSRAGFMRSPVLASWRSPAGRTSRMAIVHCNLLILITYLLILITQSVPSLPTSDYSAPYALVTPGGQKRTHQHL